MQAAVTNPGDVAVAAAANRDRAAKIEDARRIAGQALGEYEATAALVESLGQKAADHVDVNLGPIGTEAAVRQLRSLGLDKGDYAITSDGVNHFATIKESGFPKLMQPPDRARQKLTEEVLAIKRGERDDPKWVPKGAAVRTGTSFHTEGLRPSFRKAKPSFRKAKTKVKV